MKVCILGKSSFNGRLILDRDIECGIYQTAYGLLRVADDYTEFVSDGIADGELDIVFFNESLKPKL